MLIRLGGGAELTAQVRYLVVLAEIIARWPASQRALCRRVDGLQLLAGAVHDDWAWLRALRRLEPVSP